MNLTVTKKIPRPHARATWLALVCLLSVAAIACKGSNGPGPDNSSNANRASGSRADSLPDGEQILERNRALDDSRNSITRTRVRIQEQDGSVREVHMTMYRKRQDDGGRSLFVEFTAPAEERDRAAIVNISAQGEVEAARYVQSNNSFIVTKDVMGEDSLFGMTLQELADGQLEKYQLTAKGEEVFESTPVYRVEGKLKQDAVSKFPRVALLVSKESYAVLAAEFYNAQNELVRRITVNKLDRVAGHWTRMHWTVENAARQKKIDFEVLDVKYDQRMNDSIFTREHLKKAASR